MPRSKPYFLKGLIIFLSIFINFSFKNSFGGIGRRDGLKTYFHLEYWFDSNNEHFYFSFFSLNFFLYRFIRNKVCSVGDCKLAIIVKLSFLTMFFMAKLLFF